MRDNVAKMLSNLRDAQKVIVLWTLHSPRFPAHPSVAYPIIQISKSLCYYCYRCYFHRRTGLKYGIGSACIGGGQGIAVMLERA